MIEEIENGLRSVGIPKESYSWTGKTCNASIKCDGCSYEKTVQVTAAENITKAPTCSATGLATYTATFSSPFTTQTKDNVEVAINPDAHKWDDGKTTKEPTCTEKGVYTYTCEYNSEHTKTADIDIDKDAHSWDDGKVTKAATCAAKGVLTYTCKHNSEHTKTEDIAIDKDAHSWDEGKVTKEATCSAKGVLTYTCKHNSEHTKTEEIAIDKDAHSWDEGKVTKAATCAAKGVLTYTCKHNSEHTKTEDIAIDKDAHSWDEGKVTKAPTCAEKGVLTYTCKNDSSHTKTEEIAIDKDAHSWDDGKVTKEATCTEAGEKVYTCKNDNTHTRKEVIPAAGHKLTATAAKEATCTADGNSAYWTCSVCKKYFSDANGKNEIKKDSWVIKAHHPADKIVTDAAVLPTCEKTGLTAGSHCSVCGEIIVAQEVIEPLGHDFMGWHTDNAGNHTNRCFTCRLEKTVACSMTALPGHEGITFCPICGYCDGEGAAMESAIVYLEKYDGVKTGVPRYYTLSLNGEKYLIISFENNGLVTRTEGVFTFTLPEEMVKGFSFTQIGADGTETPVEITESYGYYRMALDFTPEDKDPIQVMILKIAAV